MGRTMKRVPMDFGWPTGRIWKGFLNPYDGCKCPWCYDEQERSSNGATKEAREYEHSWYGFYNGHYLPNPYRPDCRYCPEAKPYAMERWEYDFIVADDDLRNRMFGCDKADVPPFEELKEWVLRNNLLMRIETLFIYRMTKEYCRRNGFETACPHCDGTGLVWQTEELHQLHENWQPIEPPTGEGYQLWETTSEGSPASPVFATFDELCEWCAENATTFASYKATKEEWAKMLSDDFVCHQEGNVIMI